MLALRRGQSDAHPVPQELRVAVGVALAVLALGQWLGPRIMRRRQEAVVFLALKEALHLRGRDVEPLLPML